MAWAPKKVTMDSPSMKAKPNYEDDIALFKLFPSCQHVLRTEEKLRIVDPDIRNIEFVLSNKPCPCCSGKGELITVDEVYEQIRESWFEESLESDTPYDEFDLCSRRWELDITYIAQMKLAFDDQIQDPSHPIVHENHLHNARQQAESQLRSLQNKQTTVNTQEIANYQESFYSTRHGIQLEWAKMQGEYLGRTWVDMARPEPKKAAVSPAPGDICINLTEKLYELELIVNSTRIAKQLYYKVKYVGSPDISDWQPLADFRDEQELLYKYHKQNRNKARPNQDDWKKARAAIL